jgi:hypothetical protein
MSKPTGHYDAHGIPIHVGDLIRVPHFRHRRNGRQMWLYFRVAHNGHRAIVQNWDGLDANSRQCNLADCGVSGSEVLASSEIEHDAWGGVITFNERKRKGRT